MILKISIADARFPMGDGAGSDAIHRDPVYSYAVVKLHDDSGVTGCGFAFTLGEGNDLVCKAASFYAEQLKGKDIEELMADFGQVFYKFSNEQQFRWLGPHKGVVHLALAAVTNACYDLWAKKRGVPLWKLLIDLSPEQIVNTLDLSYLEDELTRADALKTSDLCQMLKATASAAPAMTTRRSEPKLHTRSQAAIETRQLFASKQPSHALSSRPRPGPDTSTPGQRKAKPGPVR